MLKAKAETLLKLFVLGAIAVLYLGRSLNSIDPQATGDGAEYILVTEALYNHGTPDVRYTDVLSFKQAYEQKNPWSNNIQANIFDAAALTLKSDGKEAGYTFFRDGKGRFYGYHFFLYPLINVPGRAVADWMEANPMRTQQVTNALLVVVTCFFLLFLSPFRPAYTILITLIFSFTSVYWYLGWNQTEVFITCLLTLALWFFFQEKHLTGMILAALAATHYQPLIFLLFYMSLVVLSRKGLSRKEIFKISVPYIIFLWPMLFYLVHFGSPNLIASEQGAVTFQYVTFTRIFGFFFDFNQGLMIGLPFALFLYLFLCVRKWIRMIMKKEKFDISAFLFFFLLGTVCMLSMIAYWSPVGAIIIRYASWIGAALLVHLFFLVREFRPMVHISMLNYIFCSQAAVVLFFNQYNIHDWNFEKHSVLGKWMIEQHPSLYNPDPQIFLTRTYRTFDHSSASSPVVYLSKEHELLKMMVHRDSLSQLKHYGFSSEQIEEIKAKNFINGWTYINKGDFKLAVSGDSIYKLVRRKKIFYYVDRVRSNGAWMKNIEEKARAWNKTIDEVVWMDAAWAADQEDKPSGE